MQLFEVFVALALVSADASGVLRASWHTRWLSESNADISEQAYIWGGCEDALDSQTGCELKGGLQCSSYLSDGPEDADVSLTLSNLPPSTNETDVHLSWWAGRKSVHPYDPLVSPNGCAVYRDLRMAYPSYNDTEHFNGGNVQVNESGMATVRVRQPATYVVGKWVLMPHIHLRLCNGESLASLAPDTIFFTKRGPRFVRGFHGHDHEAILDDWTPEPGISATVTSPRPTEAGDEDGIVNDTGALIDFRIKEAMETLDLDALEFSPVYGCLSQKRFYSYFTSSCVAKCPEYAVVHVGQCVRPETSQEAQRLVAAWRLTLECGDHCWHDKLNVTMHLLRLSVADRLDVPFQEVESASLTLVTKRRLNANGEGVSTADMSVSVRSKRVDAAADGPKLKSFLEDVKGASWLLGFVVHDVQALEAIPADNGDVIISISDASDPYEAAYADAADRSGVALPGVPGAEVPIWAVVTGSVLVVLAIAGIGTFLWCRKKRAPPVQEVQGVPVFQGAPPQPRGDGGTTKPDTLGAAMPDDEKAPGADKTSASSGSGI